MTAPGTCDVPAGTPRRAPRSLPWPCDWYRPRSHGGVGIRRGIAAPGPAGRPRAGRVGRAVRAGRVGAAAGSRLACLGCARFHGRPDHVRNSTSAPAARAVSGRADAGAARGGRSKDASRPGSSRARPCGIQPLSRVRRSLRCRAHTVRVMCRLRLSRTGQASACPWITPSKSLLRAGFLNVPMGGRKCQGGVGGCHGAVISPAAVAAVGPARRCPADAQRLHNSARCPRSPGRGVRRGATPAVAHPPGPPRPVGRG